MDYATIYIDELINDTNEILTVHNVIRINKDSKIFQSHITGPLNANRNTQIGPDVKSGKYLGINQSCFIARTDIGSFCTIGARTSINPFNHPIDWLSIHEFQYHEKCYDWIDEYNDFERLLRTPDMIELVKIGSDVWMGHHVNVMPGITVGDGAVIGAGAVVTHDVPPYAVVAGVPAKVIKMRFSQDIIERLLNVQWWNLPLRKLSGLPFRDVGRCLDKLEQIVK